MWHQIEKLREPLKTLGLIVAIGTIYYAAARLSLLLSFEQTNSSPFWPPSGIALAALILCGSRVWPGIFAGAFLANLFTFLIYGKADVSTILAVSTLIGLGNTLEAVAGMRLLKKWGASHPLENIQSLFKFLLIVIVICLISSAIGVTSLALFKVINWSLYPRVWFTWWMGDVSGALMFTPMILTFRQLFPQKEILSAKLEKLLFFILLFLVSQIIFQNWAQPKILINQGYILIPLLLWSVFRFGQAAAMTAVVLVALIATWYTARGIGPLSGTDMNNALLSLQIFIVVVSSTMMVLTAALNSQKKAERRLKEINDSLEGKIHERTLSLMKQAEELNNQRVLALNMMTAAQEARRKVEHSGKELQRQSKIMQSLLEDLHESNKKTRAELAAIVEFSHDAIISETLDGIITSWNHGAEELYGYTAAETIGQHILFLVPSDHHKELQNILDNLKKGIGVNYLETKRRRKDGHIIDISLSVSPIRDKNENITGASIIARDITEKKRAEERFRRVVELAPSGMIISNNAGKIILVNMQAEKLFGYKREELIGQPIEILVPERFRNSHPKHRENFTHNPIARPMGAGRELFGLRKDGSEFPVEIGLNPIETDSGLIILSSVIDITERKKVDQLKDEFLRTVSHELRTPLAILRMGIDNLEAGRIMELNEDEREMMDLFRRNADRLERLINDLLDLSRLESRQTKINIQLVGVRPLFDELIKGFEILAAEKSIRVGFKADNILPFIKADPDLLARVINNLFNNALRFAHSHIGLEIHREGSKLHVKVSDDGDGIRPENLKALFNKFVQINRPVGGGGYKGTGLGLAICREIILLHQGSIWAESQVGVGSTFHFTIPLMAEARAIPEESPTQSDAATLS